MGGRDGKGGAEYLEIYQELMSGIGVKHPEVRRDKNKTPVLVTCGYITNHPPSQIRTLKHSDLLAHIFAFGQSSTEMLLSLFYMV